MAVGGGHQKIAGRNGIEDDKVSCRKIFLKTICDTLNLCMVGEDVLIDGLNLCNRESIHQNILTYVTNKEYSGQIGSNPAVAAIIVSSEDVEAYRNIIEERDLCYIITDLPEKIFYDIHDFLYYHTDFYHEFDFESKIGENSQIHPSVVIEDGVIIGNNVTIGANTVIKRGTTIEDNCIIGCNSTIGSEGFQVLKVGNENRKTIHAGGLLIRENAFIGDNVCVCNSLFENTSLIGKNAQIDNLCHIGHNVVVKDNAVITAGCMLCGSSVIDEGAWIGVNSSVLNRVEIGSESKIGIGSVVTRNIPDHSLAYGVPAKGKDK